MKIINRIPINNYISVCIVEYDDPVIIDNFNNRYQIFITCLNLEKYHLPTSKLKYSYFYLDTGHINNTKIPIKSDINPNKIVILTPLEYYTKLIYDKSYDDCLTYINNVQNIKSKLKKYFKIYLDFNINIFSLFRVLLIHTISNNISTHHV